MENTMKVEEVRRCANCDDVITTKDFIKLGSCPHCGKIGELNTIKTYTETFERTRISRWFHYPEYRYQLIDTTKGK